MLILKSSSDAVRIVTSSAANIDVHVDYVDVDEATGKVFTPDFQDTTISSAGGTTDISGTPASGQRRNVRTVNLRNRHAATACDITVQHYDGATAYELIKVTLAAGEEMVRNEQGTWFVYDTSGGVKTGTNAASDTVAGVIEIATQSEQETGSDVIRAVTPGRQQFHPSAAKCWVDANGAGTVVNASYNISSISDTGTGRLGVNIATDFSAANYAVVATLERSVTALTATGVEDSQIRNGSQAAGAFEVESYDHTSVTMVAQDPASYFAVAFGDQ